MAEALDKLTDVLCCLSTDRGAVMKYCNKVESGYAGAKFQFREPTLVYGYIFKRADGSVVLQDTWNTPAKIHENELYLICYP